MSHFTDPTAAAYVAGCLHNPKCPPHGAADHDAAVVVANHRIDAGYVVLCNGVCVFDDGGEILPSGELIPAHRAEPLHRAVVSLDAA